MLNATFLGIFKHFVLNVILNSAEKFNFSALEFNPICINCRVMHFYVFLGVHENLFHFYNKILHLYFHLQAREKNPWKFVCIYSNLSSSLFVKCDIQLKGTVSHFEQLNDEDGVEIFVDLRAAALETQGSLARLSPSPFDCCSYWRRDCLRVKPRNSQVIEKSQHQ